MKNHGPGYYGKYASGGRDVSRYQSEDKDLLSFYMEEYMTATASNGLKNRRRRRAPCQD